MRSASTVGSRGASALGRSDPADNYAMPEAMGGRLGSGENRIRRGGGHPNVYRPANTLVAAAVGFVSE
jgi:hypothetical protein